MKLGYPCINNSINCTANTTFRLASYSNKRIKETISNNLNCLREILKFNVENKIFFFRIGSPLIPFASHPICKFNWKNYFKKEFKELGDYIKENRFRITMHPDQFVVINSNDKGVVKRSIKELIYHSEVLDALGLDYSAKIVIHVGGVYQDKPLSIKRFIENYKKLPDKIKKRLVIENDHRSYSLKDCLEINEEIKIPIVFDSFHHECLNNNEPMGQAIKLASKTWQKKDGNLIMHYSEQKINAMKGSHSNSINLKKFKNLLKEIGSIKTDIVLEIKDKEISALKAIELIKK